MDEALKSYIDTSLSLEEADYLSKQISSVPGMLGIDGFYYKEHFDNYGGLSLRDSCSNNVIGGIKLQREVSEDNKIILYESGGLYIHPNFREEGAAKKLKISLSNLYIDKPMYSVTDKLAVKKINNEIGNIELLSSQIKDDILRIISNVGPLGEKDVVFFNQTALDLYNIKK